MRTMAEIATVSDLIELGFKTLVGGVGAMGWFAFKGIKQEMKENSKAIADNRLEAALAYAKTTDVVRLHERIDTMNDKIDDVLKYLRAMPACPYNDKDHC